MLSKLKHAWRHFHKPPVGYRFQQRYREKQQGSGNVLMRMLSIVFGAALVASGLFFIIAPGPGITMVLIGAAMMAGSSIFAAKAADWAALKARDGCKRLRDYWRRSPMGPRTALSTAAILLVLAMGFASYRMVFGDFVFG